MSWFLDSQDIDNIALGAGILGTGGGGSTRLTRLRAQTLLKEGRKIEVVSPDALEDDDLIIAVGGMGAPTIGIERIAEGGECLRAVRAVEAAAGIKSTALITDEIGGGNSIEPMIAAALAGLPVVDVDGMGRAFPELQMSTFFIHGLNPSGGALADDKGNSVVLTNMISPHWLERVARSITVSMGCSAAFALPPMRGDFLKKAGIRNTISQAWRLGEAVLAARKAKRDPIETIVSRENGRLLFRGKVVDARRWTTGGFARGELSIDGFHEFADSRLAIDFQNENLIARLDSEVVAIVPDLICIVDAETGRAISTEDMRYGLRVAVIAIPCSPLLRTDKALATLGPKAFGYDDDYKPIGAYVDPKPVYQT